MDVVVKQGDPISISDARRGRRRYEKIVLRIVNRDLNNL